MAKKKNFKGKWLLIGGLLIIFITHIYMLFVTLELNQQIPHAIINLISVVLVTIAYFLKR